ncbi:MAG: M12 family metallo-peptidase [Phycisphaerales bacterium]
MSVLTVDRSALRAAFARDQAVTLSNIPMPDGSRLDLVVEPFRVFAPGARIIVADETGEREADFDPASVLHLHGRVAGVPGSHVFLSMADGSATGRIEMGASQPTFVISSEGGKPARGGVDMDEDEIAIFEAERTFAPQTVASMCDAPDGTPGPGPFEPGIARGTRRVKLAVDTDYELFRILGDQTKLFNYVSHLYATVSDLSMRDTGVRFDLIYLRIFTAPDDPYGSGAGFPILSSGEIGFDVAQLFSGSRTPSAGGAAYICGRASWVAHATGQFTDPTARSVFNQDLRITAHELGHNIGGPHPHDIGVDECDDGFARSRRGSLISYCAQTYSGRAALVDPHYHTAIRERIATCSPGYTLDCNQNYIDDVLDIAEGRSADANMNGVPDECEDCNGNGVLDTEDIAMGTSFDLNTNGIPDECEPDCNGNGVPDDLDLISTNSEDANGDGIPDECQADRDGNGRADWTDIFEDMSLDLDRDGILDATQDCDGDGVMDIDQLDHAHSLWAVSSAHDTIKEYHYRSGVLRGQAEGNYLVEPTDVLITADRRVLVADAGDGSVAEFDRTGGFVRDLVSPGAGGLVSPIAMVLAPDGSLLAADQELHAVLRYDAATGAFLGVFVESGAGGLVEPRAMAYKPGGNLFVTSGDSRVLEFDRNTGAFVRVFITIEPDPDPRTIREPRGILFLQRPGGLDVQCLVACEFWFYGGIFEFDVETGELIGEWSDGTFGGKLRSPWALRQGPDGNVYVSSSNLHERAERPPAATLGPQTAGLHLTQPHIFQYDAASGRLQSAYVQGYDSGLHHPKGFDFMPGPLDRNANAIPDACESVCAGDCDRSGAVDLLDFLCFQNAFAAGDARADCTGDGVLDLFDFLCFQRAFDAGCP